MDIDDSDNTELSYEIVEMKLSVEEKISSNIFEIITLEMSPNRNTNLLELKETYDSLVWIVTDLGRLNVLTSSDNRVQFSTQWSHNFFIPKKYETVLVGYKDDQMIMTDTLFLDIKNNKDFLRFNWEDITESSFVSTGYYNAFLEEANFSTYYNFENDRPSADLFIWYNEKCDEKTFSENSQKALLGLMNELYSEPKYSITEDYNLLLKKYDTLFKNKTEENAEPLNIWITPISRIVLFKYEGIVLSNAPEYKIHVEPNY